LKNNFKTSKVEQILTTNIDKNILLDGKKIVVGDWYFKNFDEYKKIIKDKNYSYTSNSIKTPEELSNDYTYVQELLDLYSLSLTKYLNKFHKTEYSHRYWSILLLPWLVCYIPTHLFRWKTIDKILSDKKKVLFSNSCENRKIYSNTTLDYLQLISTNDYFNYLVFQKIMFFFKKIKKENISFIDSKFNVKELKSKKIYYKKVKILFYKFIEFFNIKFIKKNLIYIDDLLFKKKTFIKINVSLNQFPGILFNKTYEDLLLSELDYEQTSREKVEFEKIKNNNKKDEFINFLNTHIKFDIPKCFLEGFLILKKSTDSINLKPKLIVSAYHHHNERMKFWIAKNILRDKCKFFPATHGGGNNLMYPSCYQFERKIGDKKLIWSQPREINDVQIPATKFMDFKMHRRKNLHISYVGKPNKKYPVRITSDEFYDSFKNIKNIILLKENLNQNVFKSFIYLPHVSENNFQKEELVKILGEKYINKTNILHKYLRTSKLLICSYAETAFLEGVLTGPTILISNFKKTPLNDNDNKIQELLIKNKIVFENINDAIDHINKIAGDPYVWWSTKDVQNSIKQFTNKFLYLEKHPIQKWEFFLRKQLQELS
jgi:putative transferase (TIGR04331 family)